MKRRPDAVSVVLGLLATMLAIGGLWLSLGGNVDWSALRVAAPLVLVLVGIIGLAASRPRS
ncbi:MAG: hypothetical protein J2P23_10690 [Microlunatus sp.]|nr:hypothetical protein [Microlunatus sp.]